MLLSPSALSQHALEPDYNEPLRPQVHFSPKKNWTNDPNGLVYFEGEYHLFYQYNPMGDMWGHMSWGHAVSHDLLHWQELPVAIPESGGEMIFTGSVVVDENNTSGLCLDGKPCLVAIFTGHRGSGASQQEVQNIAVSQDRGRSWQLYSENPVLDLKMANFRDPSVSWNRKANAWIMAVALPEEHQVAFYRSPDLKQWTRLSVFGPVGATGGAWECPDLLEVPNRTGNGSMWALKVGLNPGGVQGGSGEQYFLGTFDGVSFLPSQSSSLPRWTDYGKDSYCTISYNNLPKGKSPTLLGWMDNWQYAEKLPTSPWRGQMTLARQISVVQDKAGLSLAQQPVIEPLRMKGEPLAASLASGQDAVSLHKVEAPEEMDLSFKPSNASVFGVRLYSDEEHWVEIAFDRTSGILYTDRTKAGRETVEGFPAKTNAPVSEDRPWDLHLVLDRSSVEVFAQKGTIAMTNLLLPASRWTRIELFRRGGRGAVDVSGTAWPLSSGWSTPSDAH
ncbi:MAG TPA: glycoside hydrolase family 32 protein [Granulicella sp.]